MLLQGVRSTSGQQSVTHLCDGEPPLGSGRLKTETNIFNTLSPLLMLCEALLPRSVPSDSNLGSGSLLESKVFKCF